MMDLAKLFLAALGLSIASPTLANDTEVTSLVNVEDDGTRTLIHEAVIEAPAELVWWTLSTAEGWKVWGPKFAYFDLRNGGSIETGYHDGASKGDPQNIRHRILAVVPEKMLAIQVEQAPENGPVNIDAIKRVWGVYEIEAIDEGRTLLRISGVGYGSDEASSQILEFFKSGNVYSINLMRQNLREKSDKQ